IPAVAPAKRLSTAQSVQRRGFEVVLFRSVAADLFTRGRIESFLVFTARSGLRLCRSCHRLARPGKAANSPSARQAAEPDPQDEARSRFTAAAEGGMPKLTAPPPHSTVEPVTEMFHGVSVTDPYRWLEDQDSPRTRAWIEEQTCYARPYLDNISGR